MAFSGTIAPTDIGWYEFLSAHPELVEVNFWTPSATHAVNAEPLSPFLFKLKAPHSAICGFGYYGRYARLPAWLAWECFGIGNGCVDFTAMRTRIDLIRDRIDFRGQSKAEIGCVLIANPVFFAKKDWIPQPSDWPKKSLRATKYDLSSAEGVRVWNTCLELAGNPSDATIPLSATTASEHGPRYGSPRLVAPRLGQGIFRVAVTDAYGRACAVTGEHSLPALEAAHIQSFADEGPHDVRNGILLRADLHRLFDQGYVTVTPDLIFRVSDRLRADFNNGKSYYPLDGTRLTLPEKESERPLAEFLQWHQDRFLG